jgi:hypothetical protein
MRQIMGDDRFAKGLIFAKPCRARSAAGVCFETLSRQSAELNKKAACFQAAWF